MVILKYSDPKKAKIEDTSRKTPIPILVQKMHKE